ncbi:MAG: hypothetical protein FWG56_10860 [Desulfovibrionaceae bacterium]|nr:hypothetical protein [Desulfovibrionaceae bacterium]
MRITAIILIVTALISGCVTAPPLPKIESSRGDRIGLFVEVGDSPSHTHIGTTVFNNFVKNYSYNWNLGADVTRTVEQTIAGAGFTVVDLRKEGLNYAEVSGLIQPVKGGWQIVPGKEGMIRRLREEFRLKALLVVKEGQATAALECAGGPCVARYVNNSGLYTHSIFGLTAYLAVAAYRWNVFVLDPVADVAMADPLKTMLQYPSVRLFGFKSPVDFKNLTEAEFVPVRDAILKFTEKVSKEAVKDLNVK